METRPSPLRSVHHLPRVCLDELGFGVGKQIVAPCLDLVELSTDGIVSLLIPELINLLKLGVQSSDIVSCFLPRCDYVAVRVLAELLEFVRGIDGLILR